MTSMKDIVYTNDVVRPKSKKSVSRRSSILKASVVQTPVRNVQCNVSLYQESPTITKQKRRVSFAEKKHVKEFCDSAERGTVWDTTYEESSNENTGKIELNNQLINPINNDDKSLDLTEPINTMGSVKSHSFISNPNIDICTDKNIIVYNDTSSLNESENGELNKTCIQDISMEVTELPYVMKTQNIVSMAHKVLLEDKENIPISNIIHRTNVQSILRDRKENISTKTQHSCAQQLDFAEVSELQQKFPKGNQFANDKHIYNEKTQIFQNVPMEMTSVIPLISKADCIDQTVIFHDKSMDDTSIVTSVINNNQIAKSSDISEMENNKTKLVDTSMEITNGIQFLLHAKQIADEETHEKTQELYESKTKVFQDESMDITAPMNVPDIFQYDNRKVNDSTTNLCRITQDINASKTRIFQNESMAITAPIHVPDTLQYENKQVNESTINLCRINQDINASKTRIFQNESMAITAPVHMPDTLQYENKQVNESTINLCRINQDINASKTRIFQNESMAITAPVHMPDTLQYENKQVTESTTNLCRINQDINASKTRIFQNESMAITAPIHMPDTLQSDNKKVNDSTINLLRNSAGITSSNQKLCKNIPIDSSSTAKNILILPDLGELPENADNNCINSNILKNKEEATINNNKSIHNTENDILNSSVTSDTEYFESSSIKSHTVNALTSLITSFVYADMMEEDSFGILSQNELQFMESDIAQQTDFHEDKSSTISMLNTVNKENTQSLDKCITKNEDIIREHVNCIEFHHDSRNVQEDNVTFNAKENNHDEIISDIPTEIDITRNKQLDKTETGIERKSETYVVKPQKNFNMNINEDTDYDSTNNQIGHRSNVLSPILLSDCNKSKMCIAESNLAANMPSNINLNDYNITENCNNNSLNNEINHGTLPKKFGENGTITKGTFSSLAQQLKIYMHSNDCIWDLYFEDIEKQILVISFINKSLLIVIFTQNDINTAISAIKNINVISRVESNENMLLSIAHKLIKEKISVENLNQLFKYGEDIVPLLNYVSENVKSVLDFIFDLRKLDDTNLMEIDTERITFMVSSKCTNIILKITMNIKLFDKIHSSDINIACILGTVRTEDIKELIINIKKDHRFLRRYMSDIKDYIDIIEQTDLPNM